jgi:hypothetical protein
MSSAVTISCKRPDVASAVNAQKRGIYAMEIGGNLTGIRRKKSWIRESGHNRRSHSIHEDPGDRSRLLQTPIRCIVPRRIPWGLDPFCPV